MVVCEHCEYEWEYKGLLGYATCPYCLNKTKVKSDEDKQA